MKTSEVKINNLVTHKDFGECTIFGIDKDSVRIKKSDGTITDWIDVKDLAGVILTKEWLDKFGFEWIIYYQANHKVGFKFDLNELYKGGYSLSTFKKEVILIEKLEFLHQLQNVYFSLTTKELTEIN